MLPFNGYWSEGHVDAFITRHLFSMLFCKLCTNLRIKNDHAMQDCMYDFKVCSNYIIICNIPLPFFLLLMNSILIKRNEVIIIIASK